MAVTLPSLAVEPFVTSPFVSPTVPSGVKADLTGRLPVFDEITALADPDDSKFQTLAQFVAVLDPAQQSANKSDLMSEGFQGAYYDVGTSALGGRIYNVVLMRFATAAGATSHLSHFVTGPYGSSSRLTGVASSVPGGHEFTGKTVDGKAVIDITYLSVGRYFASAEVLASPGDESYRSEAKTLTAAVHDSLQ